MDSLRCYIYGKKDIYLLKLHAGPLNIMAEVVSTGKYTKTIDFIRSKTLSIWLIKMKTDQ